MYVGCSVEFYHFLATGSLALFIEYTVLYSVISKDVPMVAALGVDRIFCVVGLVLKGCSNLTSKDSTAKV